MRRKRLYYREPSRLASTTPSKISASQPRTINFNTIYLRTMAPKQKQKSRIPNSVRHRILCLRLSQFSLSDIAKKTGVNRSTIFSIIRKFRTTGSYLNAVPQRQRKLDDRLLRRLSRELEKNPRTPLADITTSAQLNISRATVYRGLKKLGYKSRIPRVKPYHD